MEATPMPVSLEDVRRWDKEDPLRRHRETFVLPDGVVYMDGNSLGPLPHATRRHLACVVDEEWGGGLIRSWDAGWLDMPARIGGMLAPILGVEADEVIAGDSTSVNLFKLCAAAAALRPRRNVLLTEAGNFPTDRHVLDGLARLLPGARTQAVRADDLPAAMGDETAVVLLCHVDYRSGARHDMAALTEAARAAGAIAIWDLSHSAGAVALDLRRDGVEMAVGCGYKFLNGGPGAPSFLHVARGLQAEARSPLQGWFGHAAPFGFSDVYQPASGISRFLAGTPGILGLAALEAGLREFLAADPVALWAKSARLFDLFADMAAVVCPHLQLLTPRAPERRGSHISFRHQEARAIMRHLAAGGIIGDHRPPDILRFGLTPLYQRFEDVWRTVEALSGSLG